MKIVRTRLLQELVDITSKDTGTFTLVITDFSCTLLTQIIFLKHEELLVEFHKLNFEQMKKN